MKFLVILAAVTAMGCASASKYDTDAGAAPVMRGIARPKKMGNGSHNGGGVANDRKERRANKPKDHRKPRGGDARNSSIST